MPSKLEAPSVYMRIRPQTDVGGHAQLGQPASGKCLRGWDDDGVTITWTCSGNADIGHEIAEGERYDYCRRVLKPEATQNDVYATVAPPLVSRLLGEHGLPTDVLLFAYGQTGTGKTHTMLGTDASLRQAPPDGSVDPDWGVFPRLAYDVFARLRATGRPFVVSMSAVEFYLCAAADLLEPGRTLAVVDSEPIGMRHVVLRQPEDAIPALARARANRHTRSTAMNHTGQKGTESEHAGSSRGHACLLLTVLQLDPTTGKFAKSVLNLVDLAGAERPSKTGAERKGAVAAMQDVYAYAVAAREGRPQPELSLGSQAFFINFELYNLGDAVLKATDFNKQKRGQAQYKPPDLCNTDAVRMMGKCFGGRAHVAVVVALSQAPQCGWETWFSCKYGRDLARLRAPVHGNAFEAPKGLVQHLLGAIRGDLAALERGVGTFRTQSTRRARVAENQTTLALVEVLLQKAGTSAADFADEQMKQHIVIASLGSLA